MNHDRDLIVWNYRFACGIKVIDEQHKGLVKLVNEMFNHVTGNIEQEQEYFSRVIHEAVDYVKYHFATEEKIMLAAKYSGYAEHKKAHANFIQAIVENSREYEIGRRFTLSTFTKYLKDWVLSHIALEDKQYFVYFRKIATRNTEGKLVINFNQL